MYTTIGSAAIFIALAASVSAEECSMFRDKMQSLNCMPDRKLVVCSDECLQHALSLKEGIAPGQDCMNFNICKNMAPGCDFEVCDKSDLEDLTADTLDAKRPYLPFSNPTELKCKGEAGETEIRLPCLNPGDKVYYSVEIHNVSGIQFEVFSKAGTPLQLSEMFSITDAENDEVFDCFPRDTVDTSSCYNAYLSRGLRVPTPVVWDPKMNVRFGFKACAGYSPVDCATNPIFLSFKTTGLKTASKPVVTFSEFSPGCTTPVKKMTLPLADNLICKDK
eukprot:TRINITY_DN2343_c1_g3_i2.p1 TRINITY_DN2343_c1_g3~~TRINITY_DN2343_c1_g3_i2.p1  ORF type:complete len:277 (+),score=35.89 TRINITY_DN2343_c1_g3_i2:51-881(+)